MDESTILIIGANGQLGKALTAKYPNTKAVDQDSLDISDINQISKYDWTNIKVIINAAAYTNVDGAETHEGRVSAWQANALAPANLARVAQQQGIILVHISTDYVFDGNQDPHTETEPFSPLSIYGASKAAGDIAISIVPKHYILRTSWVIGEGKNFVRTMLELGKKGVNPSVVSDQIGRLTFTQTLVEAFDYLLRNSCEFGIYNVSNDGLVVSWADITRKIFELADFKNTVTDTTTAEYYKDKPEAAPRPLNSELDLSKIKSIGFKPKDWQVDLADYIKKELSK